MSIEKSFKTRISIALCAVLVVAASCSDNTTSVEEPKTIQELIARAGEIPAAPTKSESDLGFVNEQMTENGVSYTSRTARKKLHNRFDEIVAFGASSDALYPGSIIQGKSLADGQLTPISSSLKPLTLTLQGGKSQTVTTPTFASVNSAIQSLAATSNPKAADIKYFKSTMYSSESSFLELGLNFNWLLGSVKSKFESRKGVKRASTLLYMKQVYFRVSCDKPSFDDDVTVSQLMPYMGQGNPPCYISSVDYGRIFLVRVTADTTQEALDNAIAASYSVFSVSTGFGSMNLNVNTTFDALVLGGSASGAGEALSYASLEKINELIRKEAQYSPNNPGVPIAYSVRHLGSQTPVILGASAEYGVPKWETDLSNMQQFTLTIKGVHVQNDCDFGTAGDGDFFYNFTVVDNEGKILVEPVEVPWNRSRQRGDGTYLDINAVLNFYVPKQNGSRWRLIGYVRDSDSDSNPDDFQEMGAIDWNFEFPWQHDVYNTDRQFTLRSSDACQGVLLYRIDKR